MCAGILGIRHTWPTSFASRVHLSVLLPIILNAHNGRMVPFHTNTPFRRNKTRILKKYLIMSLFAGKLVSLHHPQCTYAAIFCQEDFPGASNK
jgi:hypothetical protein